jgi:hypothetical protein
MLYTSFMRYILYAPAPNFDRNVAESLSRLIRHPGISWKIDEVSVNVADWALVLYDS